MSDKTNMGETWPIVSPIAESDMPELEKAVTENGFTVVLPTHVVRRGPEFIGYFTISNVPLWHFWFHTEKVKPRESFDLMTVGLNIARGLGLKKCIVPVIHSSPFSVLTGRCGFTPIGDTTLYLKDL
jgi:hypothetical protein